MGITIESRIKEFIDSLSPDQISIAKEIMFHISSRDLINKVKKIYEQPKPNTGNFTSDID